MPLPPAISQHFDGLGRDLARKRPASACAAARHFVQTRKQVHNAVKTSPTQRAALSHLYGKIKLCYIIDRREPCAQCASRLQNMVHVELSVQISSFIYAKDDESCCSSFVSKDTVPSVAPGTQRKNHHIMQQNRALHGNNAALRTPEWPSTATNSFRQRLPHNRTLCRSPHILSLNELLLAIPTLYIFAPSACIANIARKTKSLSLTAAVPHHPLFPQPPHAPCPLPHLEVPLPTRLALYSLVPPPVHLETPRGWMSRLSPQR